MSKKARSVITILSVLPFVLGTAGYVQAGERLLDALYYSLGLYFVSLNSDAGNGLIETARWGAALTAMAAVLQVLRAAGLNVYRVFTSMRNDSVAVYGERDRRIFFENPRQAVVYGGEEFFPGAKSHIVLFDSDRENMAFYHEHQLQLGEKAVYIRMSERQYGWMSDQKNIHFFDPDGIAARTLWKSVCLWERCRSKKDLTITIMGSGHRAQSILNHALLMNLFARDQEITYYLAGDNSLYELEHGEVRTCNRDQVHYYAAGDEAVWEKVGQSDLVIVAEEVSFQMLQTIGILCGSGNVYYYSPEGDGMNSYVNLDNLIPFGRDCDIYTDANIRRGQAVRLAKKLHYQYVENTRGRDAAAGEDEEWDKLDGFQQWSNISSADFGEVIWKMAGSDEGPDETAVEELAELEHIRWCRQHFLDHWKYGVPDQGGVKDEERKIHACLCSFQELGEEDKEKDREAVRQMLRFFSDNEI